MDHIELSQPSNRHSQVPLTGGGGGSSSSSSHQQQQQQQQRAASLQSRPSIRIQRWPSSSYFQPRNNNSSNNNPFLSPPIDNSSGNSSSRNRRAARATTVSAPTDAPHIASRDFAGGNNTANENDVPSKSTTPGLHHQTRREELQQEEEELATGRRRSSSEPRRGRWSTPPALSTPALSVQGPDETSSSPMPPLAEERDAQHRNHRSDDAQESNKEYLEPPASDNTQNNNRRSLGRLRRVSSAAMNRLSPNRSSSASNGSRNRSPGVWSTGGVHHGDKSGKGEEYDPLMVDFLDVIGKFFRFFFSSSFFLCLF